jgi:diguanylate cyclase (GGDEF)-like protein
MSLPLALNSVLGSVLIITLIFANYVRKYNADRCQWTIFCRLLIFTFIPMAIDFVFLLLSGTPGRIIYILSRLLGSFYYIFDVLAYSYIVVFVDYMVFRDSGRIKKINIIIFIITVLHIIVLLINIKYHFYFVIDTATNMIIRGDKYFIRLIFCYCPLLFAAWDLVSSYSAFKKSHRALMFLLLGLSFSGLTVDVFTGNMRLAWPCLSAAMLYAYFFIVQSDSRLDSLTGIGNRFSFNEFTDRLSRQSSGEAWAIVMIDMDHFKAINDKLGHLEGDNALRDMAAIIKSCVSGTDFAARYGGDEFVLAAKQERGIEKLMEQIKTAVEQHNAKNIRPFKLELSYGHDVYVADGKHSIEEFLTHIDSLMYKNKEERRRSSDKREAGR